MDRFLRGNYFTKAGVSTALWDAFGRTVGLPVATLLGGPFRDEVPVKISLSGDDDVLRAGYETAAVEVDQGGEWRRGASGRRAT